MNENHGILTLINALSDPVLLIGPNKGQILAANDAFTDEWGLLRKDLDGRSFLRLKCFSRGVRRGFVGIYARARRGDAKIPAYFFHYEDMSRNIRTISVTARPIEALLSPVSGRMCVMMHFNIMPPAVSNSFKNRDELEAFEILSDITSEPWLEFRPSAEHDIMEDDLSARTDALSLMARRLHLFRANRHARHTYGLSQDGGTGGSSLKDKTFLSFFNRKEDGLRMLDILSSIGFIRTETSLVGANGRVINAEVSCAVKFGMGDSIEALYCIFRVSENLSKYNDTISALQHERSFAFSQPFAGFAQLVPRQPLERPEPEDIEKRLALYMKMTLITAANDAMLDIYNTPKEQFLMRDMNCIFHSADMGISVLKDLFVTRSSSVTMYGRSGRADRHLKFGALFDNADRIVRIFVACAEGDHFSEGEGRSRH